MHLVMTTHPPIGNEGTTAHLAAVAVDRHFRALLARASPALGDYQYHDDHWLALPRLPVRPVALPWELLLSRQNSGSRTDSAAQAPMPQPA